MTDLEKFYKLALNILDYEPKETIYYNGKLNLFRVHLSDDDEFTINFYIEEEKEICLRLNMFNAYYTTSENLRDIDKIIKVLNDNKVGKLLLDGIE